MNVGRRTSKFNTSLFDIECSVFDIENRKKVI